MGNNEVLIAKLEERLKAIEDNTAKILTQVTMTNGRVTKLEMWRKWLNGIWWFVCLLRVVGGSVFGLDIYHTFSTFNKMNVTAQQIKASCRLRNSQTLISICQSLTKQWWSTRSAHPSGSVHFLAQLAHERPIKCGSRIRQRGNIRHWQTGWKAWQHSLPTDGDGQHFF